MWEHLIRTAVLYLVMFGCCETTSVFAEPNATTENESAPVTTPEIYRQVKRVRAELELIRYEMGRPEAAKPIVEVKNASLRQVYFQATTLYRKTNRLCFELARNEKPIPKPPASEVAEKHVHQLMLAVFDRLQLAKKTLNIHEQSRLEPIDGSPSSSDVFLAILQANRQLNQLLDRKFKPSDCYGLVTVSVFHASRLLARFPNATRIPKAPKFERGKTPGNVFLRLLSCFERLRKIRKRYDSQTTELKLVIGVDETKQIVPSDVFDIAMLIRSELRFLDERLTGRRTTIPVYYSGHRLPAHVFQRVGVLEMQLQQLESYYEKSRSLK